MEIHPNTLPMLTSPAIRMSATLSRPAKRPIVRVVIIRGNERTQVQFGPNGAENNVQ